MTPGHRETFLYDALNRLQVGYFERVLSTTYSGVARPYSEQIGYDNLGNICAKQIAGMPAIQHYTYAGRAGCGLNGAPGSAHGHASGLPHAVESAAGGVYSYDSHGNETGATFAANAASNRYTRYTVENQAYEIARGSPTSPTQRARFWYGSDGARYKREDTQSGGVKRTLYLGNVELITHAGVTTQKRFIAGVVVQDVINGVKTTKHLFHDHLGSVVRVTNASGQVLEGMDFGAFGERRGFVDPTSVWIPPATPTTTRGYTGHEMVDGLDVVHMNGRIYDSRLGRFMQPDPIIQAPFNPQNWNAYSYVFNNPLALTDPTGYRSSGFKQIVGIVMAAAILYVSGGTAITLWGQGAYAAAIATAAVGGFVASGINGGMQAGVQGAFTSVAFLGAGVFANAAKFGRVGRAVTVGLTSGIMSDIQGGKFGNAFASAGITAMVMPSIDTGNDVVNSVTAALVGGTISEATGGKFANGAITVAFSYAMSNMAKRGGGGGDDYVELGDVDVSTYYSEDAQLSSYDLVLLRKNSAAWSNASNATNDSAMIEVIGHGHENGKAVFDRLGRSVNAERLDLMIRDYTDFNQNPRPVHLHVCWAGKGSNPLAQQLADRLGVSVSAPTRQGLIYESGRYAAKVPGVHKTFNPSAQP